MCAAEGGVLLMCVLLREVCCWHYVVITINTMLLKLNVHIAVALLLMLLCC